MRSFEHCKVQGERKTKLLAVKNFDFYKNKKLLSLYDANIEQADYMKIVFEAQKNDMKNQSVYHDQTNHSTLCPIKIWARIIERIMNIKGSSLNSTVNTILLPNSSTH